MSDAAFDDLKQQFQLLNFDITFAKCLLDVIIILSSNGEVSSWCEELDNVGISCPAFSLVLSPCGTFSINTFQINAQWRIILKYRHL